MASAQGTERLGKLCALPFVGSQPPCWFGPTHGGFAGTQHFAAQWPEPNALAKISFVSLRLARLQKKREGMVARMNFAPMRETKRQ
jgi:hypothetical protein